MRYTDQSDSQRQKVEGWLPGVGVAVGRGNGGLGFNGRRVYALQGALEMGEGVAPQCERT